jgi:hypothetical protein
MIFRRKEETLDRTKEEFQHKTFEVLSVSGCILVILGLLGWGFNLPDPASKEQKAKSHAKILGYSVWQLYLDGVWGLKSDIGESKLRGPASNSENTGEISLDPWGQPYQFEFRTDQQLLFVWSLGPNAKNDSEFKMPLFQHDDIGYVLDLKMKQ